MAESSYFDKKTILKVLIFFVVVLLVGKLYRTKYERNEVQDKVDNNILLPKCVFDSNRLIGNITPNLAIMKEREIVKALSKLELQSGGKWRPKTCTAKHNVAILVPYRDRQEHLQYFLLNMIAVFARQNLSFGIYVIEQLHHMKWNKGLVVNAGFIESLKESNIKWDCFVIHDVDYLVENDATPYSCPDHVIHLARGMNKRNYKNPYPEWIGGVLSFRKEAFEIINGFSNFFLGWGGEDDAVWRRIQAKKLNISYPAKGLGHYFSPVHSRADKDSFNKARLIRTGADRMLTDGLNSAKYTLHAIIKTPLYTKFIISYNEDDYKELFKY